MARAYKLNPTQVRVLQALYQEDGLTAVQIAAKIGASHVDMGGSARFGPSSDPDSLYALGYVRPVLEDDRGREVCRFYLTDAGAEAARLHKSIDTRPAEIPPAVLDPVVLSFRPTRAYGLEQYTTDDWSELRRKLPPEYAGVDLLALEKRVLARRKSGAYKEQKPLLCWICGAVEDLDVIDTASKKGVVLCPECKDRNEPYLVTRR